MKASFHKKGPGELEIHLTGELSIEHSEELKRIFELHLPNCPKIGIRVQEVDLLDLAFLQVLVAAAKKAKNAGSYISFEFQLPEDYTQLIEISGLTSSFLESVQHSE